MSWNVLRLCDERSETGGTMNGLQISFLLNMHLRKTTLKRLVIPFKNVYLMYFHVDVSDKIAVKIIKYTIHKFIEKSCYKLHVGQIL